MHSAPTSRPPDFIVFGVPRSGTKTLVRALNLHPHVYCAMERFHFRADHSRITFPDSFLDESEIRDRHDLGKVKRIREEIADKHDIRHVGNKLPRYYFTVDRINRDVPALKNIWIYRSPFGFMQSWNRRELNSNLLTNSSRHCRSSFMWDGMGTLLSSSSTASRVKLGRRSVRLNPSA
jgi:hypothetical protein